ncbi:hypothetical protein [Microvirga alba]|uniref:Uncharacterized protein n=1 Tax=Microvirga alba TaxID=2791025 RepID=A0A931BSQ6_9HYPH|nr:hypothetical protein [Microvirga alba]MBF9232142.1 hypothetical protein [Microvirga alba]
MAARQGHLYATLNCKLGLGRILKKPSLGLFLSAGHPHGDGARITLTNRRDAAAVEVNIQPPFKPLDFLKAFLIDPPRHARPFELGASIN